MLTHRYLRFISRKVKNLRTAIFFDYSPAILKMPASVIRISDVDESGNIWFAVKKPYQDMSGVEHRFFSQLRFYNKMCSYFIIIQGIAIIVTDKNALADPDFAKWNIQLDKSRFTLEHITGQPVKYFAYPSGLWNDVAIRQLKKRYTNRPFS